MMQPGCFILDYLTYLPTYDALLMFLSNILATHILLYCTAHGFITKGGILTVTALKISIVLYFNILQFGLSSRKL